MQAKVLSGLYEARIESGRISRITVGDGIAELVGYPASAIESDPQIMIDIVHPADRAKVAQALYDSAQGKPFSIQHRIFRQDGQMQWVHHSAIPLPDDDKEQMTRLVGMMFAAVSTHIFDFLPQIFNEISAPIVVRDMSQRLIYCNQSYADLYNATSPDAVLGTTYKDLLSPEYLEYFEEHILPQMQREPFSTELQIRRKDGSAVDVRAKSNVIRDEQGNPMAYYAVLDDISDIKQMQNKIQANESLMLQFVENMPAAVAMFDKQMRYLVASKRWITDYGLEETHLVGRSHYDVFPETPQTWKEVHQRVLKGEVISTDEDTFTRTDGRTEWLRWQLRPWIDETGDIGGLIMYTEVITERKLAEEALRRSEHLLRSIQNSFPAEVAVLDKDGYIIAVNEAWEKFARENGDPNLSHTGIGVNYLEVCRTATGKYSEGAREVFEGLRKLLDGELTEYQQEYICPVPTHRCWFSMRAAPLLGNAHGLVVSHFDMTDEMLIREELQASEEKYRTLVENIDGIVFRMDSDLIPVTLAGNVEGLAKRSTEEIISRREKWMGSLSSSDLKRVYSFLKELTTSGTSGFIDYRMKLPTDEIKWVRAHVKPYFSEDDKLSYYDGVIVDITDRMEAVERERRHTSRLAALAEVSQYTSSVDLEPISSAAVVRLSKAGNCLCFIMYTDYSVDLPNLRPYFAGSKRLSRRFSEAVAQGLVVPKEVFGRHEIKPIMRKNPSHISVAAQRLAEALGTGPSIWAPLYCENTFCGVIAGLRRANRKEFDVEELWLFAEVASILSASLTNAALYHRQERIAETLQRSLIPMSPEIKDLDIAKCYFPAVGEAEVGGDFYDVIDFGNSRIGVVVGDVSGKGIQAAIHTAEAKYMLRGYALQNSDPGFVMSCLNRALQAYTSEFTFVTLAYFLINVSEKHIEYVNAGHEPPIILCTHTGNVSELFPTGPVLGIENYDYKSSQVELKSDDYLFCYTDGVTDVPGNDGRYGYDRLVSAVKRSKPGTAQELLDQIISDVNSYGRGNQPDDQVVVVISPRE